MKYSHSDLTYIHIDIDSNTCGGAVTPASLPGCIQPHHATSALLDILHTNTNTNIWILKNLLAPMTCLLSVLKIN